ncbi:MAG: WYL domain-containing protein [Lachnospiraceae bacterium]|nr:WYL domain-containing protein [Lachnospiraceae bacterium]
MEGIRNKQRPFRLLKYLYENTDEEHPVTTSELVEIFKAEDAHASRKTVKDDIDILIQEGFDIITIRSTQNSFFLGGRTMEVPELKLLIDAVSSCRFISKEKSAVLIGKLKKMTSKEQAAKLTRHMYVADRVKADNHQLLYIVDTITDAINEGTKIRFQYFDYNASKERFLRHDGAEYKVSPYALLWDDNNYYMCGYSDEREGITNYRVDRMCNTHGLSEPAVPLPVGIDIEEYVEHQFRMFQGEEVDVTLECENSMMRYIIDRFGEDVETWTITDDAFGAKVQVTDSPTFYGWVFSFAGKVKITGPDRIRDKYGEMVRAAAEGNAAE